MWIREKVPVLWQNEHKNFNYVQQPVTEKEVIEWQRQGYSHTTTTGKMYGGANPMPDWCEILARMLGLNNAGFVFYRMDTLDIMPIHVDHYNTYTKLFGVDRSHVRRTIIFLENWQSGHYFEICKYSVANWQAGDCISWEPDAPHAASNIGINPRYTLQITGTRC